MFFYSLHAKTIKFFGVVAISLALLITLIVLVPTYDPDVPTSSTGDVNFEKIKTNDDRVNFLSQFGWTVNAEPVETVETKIPTNFDNVFTTYNELQKRQNLDLSNYKGKNIVRYTYEITNYPDYNGKVYANLIIYKNRVIGGDVCSADVNGFIHGFQKVG